MPGKIIRIAQRETRRLRLGLLFFTRIPVGAIPDFESAELAHSTRYLPWIGLLIGISCAILFGVVNHSLPTSVAILATIILSGVLTGFFHEDGFADVCDGFGGGSSAKEKLQIMKDSRIGVFGAVGIWIILTSKLVLLSEVGPGSIGVLLLFGQCLSRVVPLLLIYWLDYVTDDEAAKSKSVAHGVHGKEIIIGLLAILPLLLFQPIACLVFAAVSLVMLLIVGTLGRSQIGGYTGDLLGFSQQATEIAIYLAGVILWSSV
jgi:adenosylcobinamide-GDP ribazoletransferase